MYATHLLTDVVVTTGTEARVCYLFLRSSMMMAMTMIPPLTTICQYGETFNRLRPLLMTPMMRVPTMTPQTVPIPPLKEVPPMTVAVMTSSSIMLP